MGASPHPSSDKVVSLAALVVGGRWRAGYGGSEGEGRSDSQGLSGSCAEDDHDGTTSAMSKLGTSESAQGQSRVGFVGKQACRVLGRRIFGGGRGGVGESPFGRIRFQRKELRVMLGKETEVRGGREGRSDLTYSLFPVPPASILGCLWKYQACAWEGWSRQ